MATDAEIVRAIAEHARMDLDISCSNAWMVRAKDLPAGDVDQALQNAADAIEENARLRALLAEIERYDRDLLRAHDGAFVMYDDVIAALRKPDAAD